MAAWDSGHAYEQYVGRWSRKIATDFLHWLAPGPPALGQLGIFSLGAPGVLEHLLLDSGFAAVEQCTMTLPLRMPSAAQGADLTNAAAWVNTQADWARLEVVGDFMRSRALNIIGAFPLGESSSPDVGRAVDRSRPVGS